ncbi:MAG: hypothetical protein J0M18_14850 [Ignavibacteria bacterium]|nr:hypothetical protein [Ignavibacteria bacterium]
MKKIYIVILLVLTSNLFSQTLTSDEIVQKYIAAIGGIEEVKKIKQITIYGTAISGLSTFDLLAYEDAVEKYQFAHVSGIDYDVKTYYDTKTGWTLQNGVKSSLSKETLESLLPNIEDGTYFYLGDMESRGIKTELLGEERVNGKDTYKIKFTRNGKDKNIQYFDKDTYYLIMVETPGINSVQILYDKYKTVPGTNLKLPYYNEKGGIMGTIEMYEINVPLNPMLLIFDK